MPFLASVSARQAGIVLANASKPGAPTSVTASLPGTYGNTTASVSWTAPVFLGSPPLNDYVIQFSSDSGSNWTTFSDGVSTGTSVTVTGLTNGTAYVFRVAAKNAALTGDYSSASNSVTPLFGKIPTPIIGDIAETTSTIPWCFDTTYYNNYIPVQDGGTYNYVYYNFNVNAPNDQSGTCHGWTGLGENVYRETYLKVTKTGWADSDAIFIAETTNVTPPDPCAGSPAYGTFLYNDCSGNYTVPVYSDGCNGTFSGGGSLVSGSCGYPCPGGGLTGSTCPECGGPGGYECIVDGCGNFLGCND
jgi:hypothetical protein